MAEPDQRETLSVPVTIAASPTANAILRQAGIVAKIR